MGMTPLALVGGTPHDTDRYSNWLEARLAEISPLLVDNHVWPDALMSEVFGHPWLSLTYASLPLGAAVPVLTNEIKAYLAASVLDDRKADAHWFQRRIPVMRYLVEEGTNLLQHFGAACLAEIPHPGFSLSDGGGPGKTKCHNDAALGLYAAWYGQQYVASPQGLFARQRFLGHKRNMGYATRFNRAIGSLSGWNSPAGSRLACSQR